MSLRQSGVVLLTAALCSGCAVERSNHAARAQTDMVGLSKTDLYSCAGLPDRSATVDDTEFLTYFNDLLTSGGITMPVIGGGLNFFDSKYCHATFVLKNQTVTALHYAGNASSYGAPLDQCGYIIDACIEHMDREKKAQERAQEKP